jgi:asparagine synthase (glutamine-hydrolysing)
MVLHGTNGHDPEAKARLLAELEAANRVFSGLLMPQGVTATQSVDSVRRMLGFVPTTMEVWAQMGAGLLRLADADFVQRFDGRDTFRLLLNHLDVGRQLTGRDAVNQSLYIWAKTMLPNYILSNLGDRMEMAHSVEGRLPFLDHHVMVEAARMPVSMKIHGMTEKYVLREAARPVVTEAAYKRQKHPFMSPPATIQQDGRLYTLLQDTLRSGSLDGPGIYDRRKVTELLDSIPSMDTGERTRTDLLLMWMSSICLLHERLEM